MFLDKFLHAAARENASDLHLVPGSFPMIRKKTGEFQAIPNMPLLRPEDTEKMQEELVLGNSRERLKEQGDVDFGLSFSNPLDSSTLHARINLFDSIKGLCLSVRILTDKIPAMDSLRIPTSVQLLASVPYGLVLFTAPTGNGKSTSIASLLQYINSTMAKRIITIEDPVEYRISSQYSLVSQREIGRNCSSFAQGLKAALREDPDVILVGEMRDRETILTALAAAETGHLVFSTLHAGNVIQAVDRLKQYFDSSEQEQVQAQFANAFQAVVAQKLLPRKDNTGRIATFEVLLRNEATVNVIRTGKAFALPGYMTIRDGMQTMEDSVKHLKEMRLIS